MEYTPISGIEAALAPLSMTIEAKLLARALAAIVALAGKPGRYGTKATDCVLIEASADGQVRVTVSDAQTWAAVELRADVASPGAAAVPAKALADAVKKLGTGSEARISDEGDRVRISSRRAAFTLEGVDPAGFPSDPLAGFQEVECWEVDDAGDAAALADGRAEGRSVSASVAKAIARAAKRAAGSPALLARYETADDSGYGEAMRLVLIAGDITITTDLWQPELYGRSSARDTREWGYDCGRAAAAREYAAHLRSTYGLPLVEGERGRLQTHNGRALGVTYGESYWDSSEYRDAPDFTPPGGTAIINEGSAFEECEVDGVRYARMGDVAWRMYHVGTGALLYPDGAYSIFFPVNERPVTSEITVEVDGVLHPVATQGARIHLSAEQVREMVGDVSALPRREIAPLRFFQGKPVAVDAYLPAPPKLSAREALSMTADETRAYLDACRPVVLEAAPIVENEAQAPAAAPDWTADDARMPYLLRDVAGKPRGRVETPEEAMSIAARRGWFFEYAAPGREPPPSFEPIPVAAPEPVGLQPAAPDVAALVAAVEQLTARVAEIEKAHANEVRELIAATVESLVNRPAARRKRERSARLARRIGEDRNRWRMRAAEAEDPASAAAGGGYRENDDVPPPSGGMTAQLPPDPRARAIAKRPAVQDMARRRRETVARRYLAWRAERARLRAELLAERSAKPRARSPRGFKELEVAAHRNGSFGEPFHVVRFQDDGRRMHAIVFAGAGQVAVLDTDQTLDTVAFGSNSWRCEDYESALRTAVRGFELAREPALAVPPRFQLLLGGRARA